jgi:hypothetical protein
MVFLLGGIFKSYLGVYGPLFGVSVEVSVSPM